MRGYEQRQEQDKEYLDKHDIWVSMAFRNVPTELFTMTLRSSQGTAKSSEVSRKANSNCHRGGQYEGNRAL